MGAAAAAAAAATAPTFQDVGVVLVARRPNPMWIAHVVDLDGDVGNRLPLRRSRRLRDGLGRLIASCS